MMHVVLEYGIYLGQNNILAEMQLPGDGTIRFKFNNDEDMITFKLYWADRVGERFITNT